MASMKAEKSVGTQLFGQAKKEPAAAKDGAPKASGSSKSGSKKAAPKTSSEPKKKVSLLIRPIKACMHVYTSILHGLFKVSQIP